MDENNSQNYLVSSSPHIRADEDTRSIMIDVVVALLPALVIACYFFGLRALTLTVLSVTCCVIFELLYQYFLKKPVRVGDFSAVVTGVLLAFNLPASTPYFMVVVGAFFAIVIVKQLFGGIGKNFMNPALAARVFLFSWADRINVWPQPMADPALGAMDPMPVDFVTTATPLASLKNGRLPDVSFFDMALGNIGGSLGEISAFMLAMGGLYLLFRGVINIRIPLSFIGTVAILTFVFSKNADAFSFMTYHVLSGGLLLGAFFMATDYSTSPTTRWGQIIYGVGCGLLTVFIRYFGSYPEGVSFAILIMNACTWLIESYTRPRRYGVTRKKLFAAKGGEAK